MKVKDSAYKLSVITRSKDWRFSLVSFIVGCVYLWIYFFKVPFNFNGFQLFSMVLVTTFGFASLGYFINDYFDRETDKIAGKSNRLSSVSPLQQILLLIASLAISFLPWFFLPTDKISWLLILLELAFFLLYSLPFPRLKGIPFISGIIDSCYAYVIFFLLIFHTYALHSHQTFQPFVIFFGLGIFFIGFRNITIHHLNDITNDMRSGIVTLPQKIGIPKTDFLIKILLFLEIILVLYSSFLIANEHHYFFCWLILYVLILAIKLYQTVLLSNSIEKFRHLTDVAYQLWFPLITLILTFTTDWRWVFIFPLHVIVLVPSHHLRKLKEWILFAFEKIKIHFVYPSRLYLSRGINYSIYYSFRLFGIDLKKEKKSAWEYFKRYFEETKIKF